MVTHAQNETWCRVGPGTPAGELLRRYWHPVAIAGDLDDAHPIRAVELLGEKLVVFRLKDAAGLVRFGLMAEQCRHRFASLAYGQVDSTGIRCPYHGWKYDLSGACVEQPAEPAKSTLCAKVRQPAYPVRRLGGLLFAYLGPAPAPLLPRWDVLGREDGRRWVVDDGVIGCNWLQPMENSVDPAHFYWLHGSLSRPEILGPRKMAQYDETHAFTRFEYGIMKRRTKPGKDPGDAPIVDEHPLLFPTTLRLDIDVRGTRQVRHVLQLRVPLDDVRTRHYSVNFIPSDTVRTPADGETPFERVSIRKPDGSYDMDLILAQDIMAWETQGAITDRTQEQLGASDRGIVMLRRMLTEQIEAVARGEDPIGVRRGEETGEVVWFHTRQDHLGLTPSEVA